MITFLVVVACIAAYGLFGGIAARLVYLYLSSRYLSDADAAAVLVAPFWPIGLPVLAGVALVDRLSRKPTPKPRYVRNVTSSPPPEDY